MPRQSTRARYATRQTMPPAALMSSNVARDDKDRYVTFERFEGAMDHHSTAHRPDDHFTGIGVPSGTGTALILFFGLPDITRSL